MLKKFLLVSAAVLALMVAAPLAAGAVCAKSYPSGNSVSDPTGDAGLAPDLTGVNAYFGRKCDVSLAMGVSDGAVVLPGESFSWYIDSDDDITTGSQDPVVGSDALITISSAGAVISKFTVTGFVPIGPVERIADTRSFRVKTNPESIGAKPNVAIQVSAVASWTASGQVYKDFAPNVGATRLRLTATFQEPACVVPRVTGFTLAKAKSRIRAAGCRVGKTKSRAAKKSKRGRPLATSPARGKEVPLGTKVTVYVGGSK